MERYHMFKLGWAILFYAAYCIRPMLVSGLRSSSIVTNQTLREEDYNVFYQGVDGTPGVDFPVLSFIPRTTFTCDGIESGYYADLDTDCQVFHICEEGKKISFLCPNGTIFEQADLICEWWYKVNCTNAPNLYQDSAEILREDLARRKASRRISLNGQERNHGAVMRMEESASISAQQNGKPYRITSSRGGRINQEGASVANTPVRSSNNLIQSAINKGLQNVPQKRYNDASTGNFINENGEKQVYTRSTTPSSSVRGFSSNLGEYPSRKQSNANRGSVKFGSFGSRTTQSTESTPSNEYDLEFPKHKSEIINEDYRPSPTSGSHLVKIDSSKVDLGRIKPKGSVGLSRNNLINRRPESSESDELQVPQETAAFTPNTYNSIQSNTRKFVTSSPHPNHRPTYSDLKRPDFSSTKFVNSINSVTPQYITTQSINSGKPFIGSTVGVFNRNAEKTQQNKLSTPAISTAEQPVSFTVPPVVSTTYQSYQTDITEKSVPQAGISSAYETFSFYSTERSVPSTVNTVDTDSTEKYVSSTLQPIVSSTYQTFNTDNTEKSVPFTVQPVVSSSYPSVDLNNEISSTPLYAVSSTFSPSYEGITTKTVDHATVYGSFSTGTPTTAAPQSGVQIKLGKNVDKVSIQLSKSLGGEPPKQSGTVAPPVLASDGYVRITGSVSQPTGGGISQIHFGSDSAKESSLPSSSDTGKGYSAFGTSKTPIVVSGASISTVVPNSLTISGGTSLGPDVSGSSYKGDDKLIPSTVNSESATNTQSTTGSPDLFRTTVRNFVSTGEPSSNVIIEDNGKTGVNSVGPTGDIVIGNTENNFSGYSGIGSTVGPKLHASTAYPSDESTLIINENKSEFTATGSTVSPNLQGSTTDLPDTSYGNNEGGLSTIGYRSTEAPSATTIYSSIRSSINEINLATESTANDDNRGTVANGIGSTTTVGTGRIAVPNLGLANRSPISGYNVPKGVIKPNVFINEQSRNTVATPVKDGYDYSAPVSSVSPTETRGHSQVTELLPTPDIIDERLTLKNVSETRTNSFRPNFYPTTNKNGNVRPLIIASSAIPSLASVDNSFQSTSTVKPSGSDVSGAIGTQVNDVNLPPNYIGSTLSPIGKFSTGYKAFQDFTTPKPFTEDLSNFGFYVTRNSVYSSTTPAPFGLSKATTASSVGSSTPLINISPNSGEKVIEDVTASTPSVEKDSSLTKSETRWPRPFQRTPNSIDDEGSTKLDSVTPTYYTYKISSARPFELPKDKATPAPTIPTPFTTARSVQENVDSMINALQEIVDNQDYSSETPRPGLVIPPSAGPQTLHTLAQYFANALDGIAAEREKETGEELDKESKEKLTSLLTQMTMYRYNQLFKGTGTNDDDDDDDDEQDSAAEMTTATTEDDELLGDTSNNLVETPELRQLARNFSVALSDYLKNPDAFRKELESLRPTEPPLPVDEKTEPTVGEEELLNFSDADSKSSFPPLFSTPQSPTPTWGYIIAPKDSSDLDIKNSLNPDLHTSDTQSFVPGFNNLAVSTGKGFDKTENSNKKDVPEDHWTTSSGVTKLWQSALSVNPADLNENLDSTASYSLTTEPYVADGTASPPVGVQSEIQYELRALPKVSLNSTQVHGILIDFVNTTKTDDSNRLQRLLKKLNTTEDEFLHRMKEIESNPLTKRLILLLISECGANVTKALGNDPVKDISGVIDSYSSHATAISGSESKTANSNIPELVDPSLQGDDQDTRALQLLNSLYSIASKFGK